jgi:hypothetical protein
MPVTTFASIKTRYYGPTNHNGSRVSATDEGTFGSKFGRRRLVMSYDHGLNLTENHAKAARLWIEKFIDLPNAQLADVGLCFDGDYFWTWNFGPEGGAKEDEEGTP